MVTKFSKRLADIWSNCDADLPNMDWQKDSESPAEGTCCEVLEIVKDYFLTDETHYHHEFARRRQHIRETYHQKHKELLLIITLSVIVLRKLSIQIPKPVIYHCLYRERSKITSRNSTKSIAGLLNGYSASVFTNHLHNREIISTYHVDFNQFLQLNPRQIKRF